MNATRPHSRTHSRRVLHAFRATALILALFVGGGPAAASWGNRSDLIYGTAWTLDEGEFEVGVFTPLQYGVSDQFQIAIHPILLLILAPKLSVRWRVTPEADVTFALDGDATWSFLDRMDEEGLRVEDSRACRGKCGFPGTAQITGTVSWEVADGVMLSAGAGPALDMLDASPVRFMVALRGSALWLLDADDLLMLHVQTQLHPWAGAATSRSHAQIMYAHAWGNLHLGVGLAVGDFRLVRDQGTVRTLPGTDDTRVVYRGEKRHLPVWPVVDLWLRL